jgi:hypothetical protein
MSGPSGVRRFCCALTLEVVWSPRLVTTTTCPRALDIVWSNGRGVSGVRTRIIRPSSENSAYGRGVSGGTSPCPIGWKGFRLRAAGTEAAPGIRRWRAISAIARALSSTRPIRRRTRDEPRAGRVRPTSRLPIGSKVGCASVSRASENSIVSSTRGDQRLRARPMKSTRDVRNPSGATSAARTPMALECLSQARTACRAPTYSISANSRLYWVCPRSASGRLSTHL